MKYRKKNFKNVSPVFQRISKSLDQDQQNGNRASVVSHFNPLQSPSDLSLCRIFVEFFAKSVYLWCSDYWKINLLKDIESLHSCSYPQGKTNPQILIISFKVERNYSYPSRSSVFSKPVFFFIGIERETKLWRFGKNNYMFHDWFHNSIPLLSL